MTITGSFPQTGLQDQRDYLNQVNQTFKNLEAATASISVHSGSVPSQSALQAAWATAIPFLPPTNGGQMQWFNPVTQKIEQVFYPITGGLNDLAPYKAKPTNMGMYFIGEQVVGASSNLSIAVPNTYKHLFITYSVRGTGVGVGQEQLVCRLNGNATATHSHLGYAISTGANPAVLTGAALAQGVVGFCPQGGLTNQNQATVGTIWLQQYSLPVSANQRWSHSTCVGFSNNTRPYGKIVQRISTNYPAIATITSVTLFPVTALTFLRGSRMTVWGLM